MHGQCAAAVHALRYCKRQRILAELGTLLVDLHYCVVCGSLHKIKTGDIPWSYPQLYDFQKPCALWERGVRPHIELCYTVTFRHVQSAIKYWRTGKQHQQCLAKIMKEVKATVHEEAGVDIDFTIKPKIIENRFFLKTTQIYRNRCGENCHKLSYTALSRIMVQYCAHYQSGFAGSSNTFLVSLKNAFQSTSGNDDTQRMTFSCNRCPTDFHIERRGGEVTIQTWQNLGDGSSPSERYWASHCRTDENHRYKGATFEYEHGSIAQIYENTSRQPRFLGSSGFQEASRAISEASATEPISIGTPRRGHW